MRLFIIGNASSHALPPLLAYFSIPFPNSDTFLASSSLMVTFFPFLINTHTHNNHPTISHPNTEYSVY